MAPRGDIRPTKRVKLLDEDSSDSDSSEGGVRLNGSSSSQAPNGELKVNQEYARRHEYNNKRAEQHRLEEKYGKGAEDDAESSSDEEDEDEGDLATEQVDQEIFATLNAIRSKDPRVYDKSHTFYNQQQALQDAQIKARKGKPVSLQQYQRANLLNGGGDDHDAAPTMSYAQEQENLKQDLVRQMHAAGEDEEDDSQHSEDGFLTAKSRPAEKKSKADLPDVSRADEDPEAFLSGLMTSRAWVPRDNQQMHPFESDDEDEELAADEFEQAYNMRFENPEHANEKLVSHSRTAAEDYSVRREDLKGRKKARAAEKELKQLQKQERDEEKGRLRNLRVEQTHQKLKQLKQAAGLRDEDIPADEWSKFLEAAFDSDKWDEEFQKRFGDQYYAQNDQIMDEDEDNAESNKRKKAKKPHWDNDIDIGDIIPDFNDEKDAEFSLTEDEDEDEDLAEDQMTNGNNVEDAQDTVPSKPSSKRKRDDERAERKRRSRKEHQKIEEMVDSNFDVDDLPQSNARKTPAALFRYRQTSPTSFGLSARDILLADDRELNQHHGLKKLAAFRESTRKDKDRQKLDKKKLQKWRKDTFGDRHGPTTSFQDYVKKKIDPETAASVVPPKPMASGSNEEPVKKRRKRSKKQASDAATASG